MYFFRRKTFTIFLMQCLSDVYTSKQVFLRPSALHRFIISFSWYLWGIIRYPKIDSRQKIYFFNRLTQTFTPVSPVYTAAVTDETHEDACDAYEIGGALKQVREDRSKQYSNSEGVCSGAQLRRGTNVGWTWSHSQPLRSMQYLFQFLPLYVPTDYLRRGTCE